MARKRYQRGALKLRKGKRKTVWVAQYREDVIEGGQVIRKFVKIVLGEQSDYPTKKLAQRELDRRLQDINNPNYRPTIRASYSDFAERWVATVLPMHKPSSQSSEAAHMRRYIRPFFDGMMLSEISPLVVQRFVAGLQADTIKQSSPKTIRNIYSTFRTAWKTAKQWQLVQHDVCLGIRLPQLNPVERPSFTIDEMSKIIAAAEEPMKSFFWLAAETGMRAGELCGVRVCDIDARTGVVYVRQSVWNGKAGSPKSNAGTRCFNISQGLAQHLEHLLLGYSPLSFVFHTRNEQAWDTRFVVRDHLQPILVGLGIRRAGLHAFRHGNATYRLQQGEDVKTLAQRLGHSDPSITLRVYAHAATGRDLSNKMGGVLMPQKTRLLQAV